MKRTIFTMYILIFSALCQLAAGQVTTATITISERYFATKYVGNDLNGERINIVSMSFRIGESYIGSFSASSLNSSGDIHISRTVGITDPNAKVTIDVTYGHKEWHVLTGYNHPEHNKTVTFELNPLTGSLSYPVSFFDQFTGLDDYPIFITSVDWYFYYTVSLSPFQPVIKKPENSSCYQHIKTVELSENKPAGFTYNATFLWQYGFEEEMWTKNFDFEQIFLQRLIYQLNIYFTNHYTEYGYASIDNIRLNVYRTDFYSMNEFWDLFTDPGYHNFLANKMLLLIQYQPGNDLTDDEKLFLFEYFIDAAFQVEDQYWVPPYNKEMGVYAWYDIGYSGSAELQFWPENLTEISPARTNSLKISVIAISNSIKSPRSPLEILTIKARPPSFNVRSKNSCVNKPTGEIILENISGVDPLNRYEVSTSSGSSRFTGNIHKMSSDTGLYDVLLNYSPDTHIDACPVTKTVFVESNPQLAFNVSATDATCFEKNDGMINIEVTSHHLNFNYSIPSLPGQTIFDKDNGSFANLPAGSYVVEFSDQCITKTSGTIEISRPSEVTFQSLTTADPACLSLPDGRITVTGHGDVSRFDYQILNSSGSIVASAADVQGSWSGIGLMGGDYTVKVRSAGCAWKSKDVGLNPVAPVTMSAGIKESCYGLSTGQVTISATGGKQPYKYSFESAAPKDDPVFANLSSGIYTFKVLTGAAGCPDQAIQDFEVPAFSEIVIETTSEDVSCFGEGDGKISAIISGGTAPYQLAWDRKKTDNSWEYMFISDPEPANFYKGEYRLRVQDKNLCPAIKTASIGEPELLKVESVLATDVVCFGDNGRIDITASGGSGAYSYMSFSKAGISYPGPGGGIAVPAGDYFVRVSDANNCVAEYGNASDYTVKVKGPFSPLSFSYTATDYNGFNIECNGNRTGSITISATGGYAGYVYSVDGIDQPSNIFGNAGAGTYLVSTRDNKGCIVSQTIELDEPEPLSIADLSIRPVKCYGQAQGEISVTPAGGIAGTYRYKLDGLAVESAGVFTDLYAKDYDIEVSDGNGCKLNTIHTVPSLNPPIVISLSVENVRCSGENNGKLSTSVTGGSGGFIYSWEIDRGTGWQDLGISSGSITDLAPAAYRIKASDSENCYEYKSAAIAQPEPLVIPGVTSNDVICFGEKGSINISAAGGNGSYTFSCRENAGTIYESTLTEVPVPSGIFTISVRDAKGCHTDFMNEIAVTAPAAMLDFNSTLSAYNGFNISCNGRTDGYIEITATGGNGQGYNGYLYSINNSAEYANNRFENLVKGLYNIGVTDSRGCRIEKAITLTEPQSLILTHIYSQPVKCFGEETGEVSVIASGGIADTYRYMIDGSDENSTGIFGSLKAGTYRIDVSDKNGCSNTITATVVNKNPPISTQLSASAVRCYGENNGTIISLNSGGTGDFAYTWEKKAGDLWLSRAGSLPTATSLHAGFYRLRIVDADNCQKYDSIVVDEPPALALDNVQIKDAVCFNDKGSLIPVALGGNGGYSFYTSGNNGMTYNEYSTGDLLIPASYRIMVQDSKGCEFVPPGSFEITKPASALEFDNTLSQYGEFNISCHGNNDGYISLIPHGGNGDNYTGYTFYLNSQNVPDAHIDELEAGNYSLSVVDGRGCRATQVVNLTQPESAIRFSISNMRLPVCSYDKNGSVSLIAEGGNMPYMFSVNGGDFSPSAQFSDLAVSAYSFKVRDSNGCSEVIETTLQSQVSEMQVSGIISDVKCFGGNSGSISLNVTGGLSPYNFKWEDNSAAPALSSLTKGSYKVMITDAAGCRNEKVFAIKEPENPLGLTAFTTPACVDLKDGSVNAIAAGGTPPYLFALNRKTGFSEDFLYPVYSGNHTVYVRDYNDCMAEAVVNVKTKNIKPDINFMLATSRYELDTLIVIDVSMPAPENVSWEFSPEAQVVKTDHNYAGIKYDHPGLYPVKMTGLFGSCTYSVEKILHILPFDPLAFNEEKTGNGIRSLEISPNPNDGRFELSVDLYTRQEVVVKIFDFQSRQVFNEKWTADVSFRKEIILPESSLAGNYVLWVISENDSRRSLVIKSR